MEDDEDEDMQDSPPPGPGTVDEDGDERMGEPGLRDETSQLIKNLVRYALACEYSRTPIRRDGIREKGIERSHAIHVLEMAGMLTFFLSPGHKPTRV